MVLLQNMIFGSLYKSLLNKVMSKESVTGFNLIVGDRLSVSLLCDYNDYRYGVLRLKIHTEEYDYVFDRNLTFCRTYRIVYNKVKFKGISGQGLKTRKKLSPLDPSKLTYGSNQQIWWRCSVNPKHVWADVVRYRVKGQGHCPYCTHFFVDNDNSLLNKRPDLAKELFNVNPKDIPSESKVKYLWKCSDPNHKPYRASPYSRVLNGKDCSKCGHVKGGIKRKKSIVQMDIAGKVIKKFDSQVEAAAELGLKQANISGVILGKHFTTGGFRFRFATENE